MAALPADLLTDMPQLPASDFSLLMSCCPVLSYLLDVLAVTCSIVPLLLDWLALTVPSVANASVDICAAVVTSVPADTLGMDYWPMAVIMSPASA